MPPEIRLRIWQYAIGGNLIYLERKAGRLNHVRYEYVAKPIDSKSSQPKDPKWDLMAETDVAQLRKLDPSATHSKGTAALLRACHLIYLEASHVLYTQNIFVMDVATL